MSGVTRPTGPLPARVYWTRRLLVLAVALVLVFGVAHLLGRSGGSGGPSAQPVGADQSSPASSSGSESSPPSGSPSVSTGGRPGTVATPAPAGPSGTAAATPSTPLAQPTGSCASSDVVAVPTVAAPAYAARPVVIRLTLTTRTSPACSWEVSPSSLVLKITSGPDRVWSTQDCRNAVHKQVVVVRKEAPTTVSVAWNGQRSDADCSHSTSWALPGYYHAVAAAFGADPMDVQFRLARPVAQTVTASPTPTESASAKPSGSASAKPSRRPSVKPSGGPSARPSPHASAHASGGPSAKPSTQPSARPTTQPSTRPSARPSRR